MQQPLDFYDDVNQQQLYALDKLCGLPQFVKSAEVEDKGQIATLPNTSFADPMHRKFPCHTKAATYLANAYFQQSRPLYSKENQTFVQGRLTKFANYWNINGLVDGFNKTWTKVASEGTKDMSDNDYALVYTVNDTVVKRMPMPTPGSVKLAGEYLYSNRHMYTYPMRKSAARKILRKVMEYTEKAASGEFVTDIPGGYAFNPETQEYLEKAAGFGTTHPSQAAEKVAQRVLMLSANHKDFQVKLAEIAEHLSSMDNGNPDFFMKLSSVVDAVDRESGIANFYHSGVELPEEMFFTTLVKEAEAVLNDHIRLQNGTTYQLDTFLNMPLEKISEAMGSDFSEAVQSDADIGVDPIKFAAIAQSLPRDEAFLLDKAINASLSCPSEKSARAGLMAKERWDKESLVKKFKDEGKEVLTTDFQIAIPLSKEAGISSTLGSGVASIGETVQKALNSLDKKRLIGTSAVESLGGKMSPKVDAFRRTGEVNTKGMLSGTPSNIDTGARTAKLKQILEMRRNKGLLNLGALTAGVAAPTAASAIGSALEPSYPEIRQDLPKP